MPRRASRRIAFAKWRDAVSIAFKDVAPRDWVEKVYDRTFFAILISYTKSLDTIR